MHHNQYFSLIRLNPNRCPALRAYEDTMTAPVQENQQQPSQVEQKQSEKETNFRRMENMYQRQLEAERAEKERLQQELNRKQQPVQEDDDDDDEPYVQKKKLEKKLAKFGEQNKQQTQSEIQRAVQMAIQEERKQNWLNQNKDFYDVLQHAEKFAQHDPELAETILQMPEGFERQKLVYKNIKALGLHQEKPKTPPIQEKIDANRRGAFYQPTGIGTAPYSSQGDFSKSGQKNAYENVMKKLQQRLGLS